MKRKTELQPSRDFERERGMIIMQKSMNHIMSKDEKLRQKISITYGNLKISNPNITRDDVVRAILEIEGYKK